MLTLTLLAFALACALLEAFAEHSGRADFARHVEPTGRTSHPYSHDWRNVP
jgi:hypothetical protein